MTGAVSPAAIQAADDLRIATGCAAGDPAVFEEVYRRHGSRMKSLAYQYLGNVSDAEDAVQETFLKIHRAASRFSGEASFSTWSLRILVNTCIDILRKRKRRLDDAAMEDEGATLVRSSASDDPSRRIALTRLLARLPEQRRSVFILFEVEGLSHAEIGEVLGISEANSKWILFSTKKQLQEMWNEPGRSHS